MHLSLAFAVFCFLSSTALLAQETPQISFRVVSTTFPADDVVIAAAVVTEAPYNAPADGKSDCTTALQRAIDDVAAAGGGVVYLPAGRYRCEGNLRLKNAVTLRGDWRSPETDLKVAGTILMPCAGRGKADDTAFILMEQGTGVRELTFWYPEQSIDDIVPYPYTIRQVPGDNITVHRCTFVNSYQAMRFGPDWNELHTIRQVYGTPLHCGIWMDFCTDIGRLIQIRFGPDYWLKSGLVEATDKAGENLRRYLHDNCTGVEMHRSDWEYFYDVQCVGLACGVHILAGEQGASNATLYRVEATGGGVGLLIEQMLPFGIAVSHSRFDGDVAGVLAPKSFDASAQFNGCSFGGVAKNAVQLEGSGRLSFQHCAFTDWSDRAIRADSGSLAVFDCSFDQDKPQLALSAGVARAHVLGNRFKGSPRIETAGSGDVQISHAQTDFPHPSEDAIVLPPDRKPASAKIFNVLEHGAKGDATADDTAAFQAALDAAGKAGGGTVVAPGRLFRFSGTLKVPSGVELRGVFDVPHHTVSGGTTLLVTSGKGDENGLPFLCLAPGSGLRGLTIWYPEQKIDQITAYPFAIQALGKDCHVIDVSFSNAYRGVDFGSYACDNFLLRYVMGAPLKVGFWISKSTGAMDSCHCNPHLWARRPSSYPEPNGQPDAGKLTERTWDHQQRNVDAFLIGRWRNALMVNNFVYAALHGIHFVDDGGGCSGRIINHGSDACGSSVTVESTAAEGLEFVNAQLTAFGPTSSAYLTTTETFAGKLAFFNTLSWAGSATAIVRGKGDLTLQQWTTRSGPLRLQGCRTTVQNVNFLEQHSLCVEATDGIQRAHLLGNNAPTQFTFATGAKISACMTARGAAGGTTLATTFEQGQPQPQWQDHSELVSNIDGRFCRVEAGSGREGGAGLVVSGTDVAAKPSFVYYQIFAPNLAVVSGTVLTYWMKPDTEQSRYVGVDLVFADGSTLRDSGTRDRSGNSMHPAAARGKTGTWTRIDCDLGATCAGKIVRTVLVGYDDSQSTGPFKAVIDDVSIAPPASGKAPSLSIAPEPGTYPAPLSVALNADPKTPLRFTIDGSDPTAQSPLYARPIELTEPGLYEVRCAAEAGGATQSWIFSVKKR